jgi:putative FmdB family regulatory protein
MPVYEYECRAGDGKFELIRPMSRSEECAPCPKCSAESPRAVSRFAAVSQGVGGVSTPIGGSSCGCGGCGGGSCADCGG